MTIFFVISIVLNKFLLFENFYLIEKNKRNTFLKVYLIPKNGYIMNKIIIKSLIFILAEFMTIGLA
jgi:hypothetical protein